MPDFASIFAITVNPLELVVRGTAVYWFLFLLLRIGLHRDVSSVGIADVLLLVLLADAAQNAMSGGYQSVTDGCILVGTIAGWNYFIDWLGFRVPAIQRLISPPPVPLIRNGKVIARNMRREMMTLDELKSSLRDQGIEDFAEIKVAYMESDGEVSVIRAKGPPAGERRQKKKAL
jgi:uncharacterized membrane protein YcaP (DUF421 family)